MMTFLGSLDSKNVGDALENFQASLADNSEVLAAIADDLREMVSDQFATEGRAGGTPWAELAPSTLRRSRGRRAGILYSTGALLGSLGAIGAPGHVEQLHRQSLLFGSRLPYAIFHQTGTRRMPARPIIALSGERTERWLEIVRSGIAEKAVLLGMRELGGTK